MADEVTVKFGADRADLKAALGEVRDAIKAFNADFRSQMTGVQKEAAETRSKIDTSMRGIRESIRSALGNVGSIISSALSPFRNLMSSVFSLQGAMTLLAGGGLVAMVKGALDAAAAIRDVGFAAGITTKAVQELRFAGAQNGLTYDQVDQAMIFLNRTLGEFRTTGAGAGASAFKALGLEAGIMSGQIDTAEEAFDAIVRKIQEVPNPADRAALAMDLFGRAAGPRMAEMLSQGEAGIRAAREEAQKLGLVLDDAMIAKADDASDTMNKLFETLRTTGVRAIADNADAIKDFATQVMESLPEVFEQFRQWLEYMDLLERTPVRAAQYRVTALKNEVEALEDIQNKVKEGYYWTFGGMVDPDPNASEGGTASKLAAARAALGAALVAQSEAEAEAALKRIADLNAGYQDELRRKARGGSSGIGTGLTEAGGTGKESPEVSAARSAAQQAIEIERDKQLQTLAIFRDGVQQRHDFGRISDVSYLNQMLAAAQAETDVRRRAVLDQLATEGLKPQERVRLNGELERIELDHNARMAEIQLEAQRLKEEANRAEIEAERRKQEELAALQQQRQQQIEGFINQLLSGQMNAQSILMGLAQQAQSIFAKMIAEQVSMAIWGETTQTSVKRSNWFIRRAMEQAEAKESLTTRFTAAVKKIMADAAEAFSATYAYLAPVMGPFAAIPAAGAFAAVAAMRLLVPSAAGGTEVTKDGLHMLHEKEVVLPRFWTEGLRNLIETVNFNPPVPVYAMPDRAPASPAPRMGEMPGSASGGNTYVIQAWDSQNVAEFLNRHARELGGAMARARSDGHWS